MEVETRFLSKVEKTDTCWLWKAHVAPNGYGKFYYLKRAQNAHRVSYILFNGPILDEQHICHTCYIRHCVNPNHLFSGTRSDNMRDCANKGRGNFQTDPPNKKKTHCPNGHEYTVENTWTNKIGWRWCKECNRIKANKRYHDGRDKNTTTA